MKIDSKGRRLWNEEDTGKIIALWNNGDSQHEIAQKLDSTPKAIDHKLRQLRFKKKIEYRQPRKQEPKDKSLNALKLENVKLKKYVGIKEELKRIIPFKIHKDLSDSKSESTAMVQWADWHGEEKVDPHTINELNEYNLEIFTERATHTATRTLKLIGMNQNDTHIKNLIIQAGGDFITGNIHEENMENCLLRPTQALLFVAKQLHSSIDFILNNSKLNILVVCNMGNHPRITKKVRNATEAGNSLEFIMYKNMEERYINDKRIKFIIPEGYFAYVDIYGKMFRMSHGHHIQFHGGVGGVEIPLRKAISEWNKGKHADIDLVNHFHQTIYRYRYIVNGSLIGYNAYALNNKMEFEKPSQNFFLTHKTKGITIFSPIYYDR